MLRHKNCQIIPDGCAEVLATLVQKDLHLLAGGINVVL
jgi:hypothetical protein